MKPAISSYPILLSLNLVCRHVWLMCASVSVLGECGVHPDANLEGFLPCVNKLMAFQFGALNKCLAALSADVHAGAVGVEMLPHG